MWAKIKRWFYKLIGRKSKEDEVFGIQVNSPSGGETFRADGNTFAIVKNFYTTTDVNMPFATNSPLGFVVIFHDNSFNLRRLITTPVSVSYSGGLIRVKYNRFQYQVGSTWTKDSPVTIMVYYV